MGFEWQPSLGLEFMGFYSFINGFNLESEAALSYMKVMEYATLPRSLEPVSPGSQTHIPATRPHWL